jgi:transcriptional regulator GlxA family with amidase domain
MASALAVWCVAFPGSELLDVSGPWEVLSHANELLGRQAYTLQFLTPFGGEVPTRHRLLLGGARSLAQAAKRGRPDLLLVAGGSPLGPLPAPEAALARWLARHHTHVARVVSICTGAFVLGAAGLLDGRRATTHHRWAAELQRRHPEAHVLDDGIYQRDGRIWTSAGITAGIDLTLALVEDDHGRPLSMAVAKQLLLFLRRSGHQAQFSRALSSQEHEPAALRGLAAFVLEHLDEPLSVERLARQRAMSPRSLARHCREGLGVSPAALVRQLRTERAKQLLEETDLSLEAIAARTGMGDVSTLWRSFTRQLGVTPGEYRDRFAGRGLAVEPGPARRALEPRPAPSHARR